jgi:hypothetical protein
MMVTGLSLHNRGATTIRTDYTQLGISNHTTYVALNTCICESFPWSPALHEQVRATREYITLLGVLLCQEGTCYSRISPIPVCDCLFTYVASCKVLTTTDQLMVRSLIDTAERPYLLSVWSQFIQTIF